MSKYYNQISYLLCVFSIGYLLLLSAPDAAAQFVTALDQTPTQVRICPNKKCLQIFEHPFKRGKKVVIYEKKNGWVRLSGIISPEQLQAKFPNRELPANAALWIPAGDLPPALATKFHSEEAKPVATKKPKPVTHASFPKIVPPPTPRPAQQVAELKETETLKPEQIAKPAGAKKDDSISSNQDQKAEVKLAAVETKNEPEEKTDSFGNPIVKFPSKLTKELKDKRLAKLPRKPKSGLDLKSIIAIRYHGLRLLNDGSCKAIREGNRSLSLAGWIYVMCEDDGQYRQFPVE